MTNGSAAGAVGEEGGVDQEALGEAGAAGLGLGAADAVADGGVRWQGEVLWQVEGGAGGAAARLAEQLDRALSDLKASIGQ